MMAGKKELFFATGNINKLREIREILGDGFHLKSFTDLDAPLEVEETEPTLTGNAELKAREYYKHTGIPTFADDTGLEVASLAGAPGVHTARYAGPDCKPEDNINKLLAELLEENDRRARFRTVIAYFDGETMTCFEGVLEGRIAHHKAGREGFGYDPVFIPEGETRTLAEHSPAEKNRISHRGRSLQKFISFIKK